ncbi:PAS domain S-box-containing protein [Sphingomonas palmae]|uniref:histidine kinase n=1 Tax=Sphingomonas palmae TaxID=1855283 RepID=A0A1H7TV39_9SPHN|nr:PAS domain-containing protein [Sphingomonas palmae]SEL88389.1 PAS domain S-box-containing protein [Sphingomonas palmae]
MNELRPPIALFAGSEMGERIRTHDWTRSPVGPIEGWPVELVNAVALLLPAAAEIVLFWGEEYVAFYNDAYAPTIGDKHPAALGRPAREAWRELWDDLEPLLDHVRTTGQTYSAKDRPFYIERHGFGEEVFFDISYSAIPLANGGVGGVLCIVSETTERVRAARAVAEDHARLAEMFDAAPSFMAVLREPGHRFELANASYRRLVGGREVVGRTLAEAVPEAVEQGFAELLDTVVATGTPFFGQNRTLRIETAHGQSEQERLLDFVYQPIKDAAGAVTGVFIEGVDVTERHRAEEALLASSESLELATEAAEIGTWDVDVATGLLNCSSRTKTIFGLPLDRPVTIDDFFARVHADDRDMVRAALEATTDPDRRAGYDVEYRIVRADSGEVRWLTAKGRGFFDTSGRCTRALGSLIDVTRRKVDGEQLKESERRFRALSDSLPALVWMSDEHGRLVFVNRGFETMLGIAPERMLREGWAAVLTEADARALDAARPLFLEQRKSLGRDYPVRTAGGETRWIHVEVRPHLVGDAFLGHVGCAIDVTDAHLAGEALEARIADRTAELREQIGERERVEETLHQLQRLEAVGQLTSGVAHDFNNLLTVVLGNVDVIARTVRSAGLDERTLQRLDHVRTAAQRGATLTAQLLAFSRRQHLETKTVDLNTTVSGMSALMQSTLGRAIAIETTPAHGLWPALVDPTQIELIILNLAINARDAMPDGGTLTVATANVSRGAPERPEEPPAGDYVAVSVTDTGTGMSEEVLARAFEPFFTTKEVGKGSGLGLAQVFGFAKQSGGGVRIDTAVERGTTVSVFLPRGTAITAAPKLATTGLLDVSGRTILVLDDEDAVRGVTADTLRDAGCRVIEAADGQGALDAMEEIGRVDAVVADFAMPRMNGAQFRTLAQQRWPGLPVLFVTGYADADAIRDVPDERVIRKPFTRDDLIARLYAICA